MNTLIKTKNILNKYAIKANKRFGQNFLIDDNILDDIIKVSDITAEDLVIEIGPGLGNLTEYILDKCKFSVLIEIDKSMVKIINDRFKEYNNYILLNEDILKINIDEKIKEIEKINNCKYTNIKVVANLPYYITTPILFKLLEDSNRISQITVMVQKEVAERMVANPKTKDYGILTLMVQYLSSSKIEFIVPKESFIPSPKVTSAIITLKREKRYSVNNEELLYKIIHGSFAQRRKKMINSMIFSKSIEIEKEELIKLVKEIGKNENVRAEEMSLEDFIELTNYITKKADNK